ncbi:MAG: DUF3800 domain-containing protein [Adlercreutzia sp.]|nr:DUF3800 domain-containing protein [Adlercreutzia sp.]
MHEPFLSLEEGVAPEPERRVAKATDTLYLFFDESGNFDFSRNGTPYFIMTCLATRRPFKACHDLLDARYDIFESGVYAKKFHATSDKNSVKSKVYGIIGDHLAELSAYAVLVDKQNLDEGLRSADALYSHAFGCLVSTALEGEVGNSTSRVIAITDDLPQDAKRRQVVKPLKKSLAAAAKRYGLRVWLEHFPSESDFNLQTI